MCFADWAPGARGCLIGGMCVMLFGRLLNLFIIVLPGAIVAIAGVALWAIFVRCPVCHKTLWPYYLSDYCPHCGEDLTKY